LIIGSYKLKLKPAIFFDRDGVLIEDVHLLTDKSQVKIGYKVREALEALSNLNYRFFVVTNQSVISRGLASECDIKIINTYIQKILSSDLKDRIFSFYYCPHHPQATVSCYRINCNCRKPKPGMLLRAAIEHNVDLKSSFLIGDRMSDIIAGYRAGCRTILLKSGMHKEKPIVSDSYDLTVKPNFVCTDLFEAYEIISLKSKD
jgi:D,D-heptose 1,7-bisphosphate phosphatase